MDFQSLTRNRAGVTSVTLPFLAPHVICPLMSLRALLLCRTQQALRLLAGALEDLGLEHDTCLSSSDALDSIASGHYSALILDFDLPDATMVARLARMAPSHLRPVVFAMIGATTEISGTFEAGANFVLYKPLVLEQVERSLRAGRAFMKPDRRRSPRQKLETIAYLKIGKARVPAVLLDVNEDGVSLHTVDPLPVLAEIPIRFTLPGTGNAVAAKCELIWADDGGRTGILFSQMSTESRRHLRTWLAKRGAAHKPARLVRHSEKQRRSPNVSH